uniref:Transposon TX1 uncharacterized protein n=1 Tax=Sipha flava TaxID=143950 RepID=A0A2S2QZI6_9HEMI
MGNFNTQIGRENLYRPIIELESLHLISNNNGMRIIHFATSKDLVVSSTFYSRKYIFKLTWISSDSKTKNQIYHVIINRKHEKCINNVRSYRGTDGNSNHTNNKTPGEDNINSELIKLAGKQLTTEIHKLIYYVCTREKIPVDSNMAIICPIFKKGNPTKVENYREISFLETSYKVLSLTILNRLVKYVTDIIREYQSEFIRRKSTTNHTLPSDKL